MFVGRHEYHQQRFLQDLQNWQSDKIDSESFKLRYLYLQDSIRNMRYVRTCLKVNVFSIISGHIVHTKLILISMQVQMCTQHVKKERAWILRPRI